MQARQLSILLVCGVLATAPGCQVLGIPSYRADIVGGELADGSCGEFDMACASPQPLPPLPGFFGRWQARRALPDPPEYPRFQPVPTRPMYSPRAAGDPQASYGKLPAPEAW